MTPDIELLTQYAELRDEATFAELVRRHLDHVYSTALRLVNGDAHLAKDVCQLVFADLARKAGALADCHALSSWLHTSARFAAAKLVRSEQRRRQREQATLIMPSTTQNTEPDWDQVRPILDETIAELNDADRDALLLRYFEKKPYTEIGSALGLSENAARMRVDRAVDKLRSRLAVRGITSTIAALGTALAQELVVPAPASLGTQILSQTLAGAGAAGVTATGLTLAAKLALAALAVGACVTVGILVQPEKPAATNAVAISATGGGLNARPLPAATNQTLNTKNRASVKGVKRRLLELYLVDKQTGLPIADQTIGLRGWAAGSQTLVEKKVEVKNGRCLSPFDPNYAPDFFWVLTHVDGYADVRLRWEKERGQIIPDSYTVRLVPPVLIHGSVVDPSGNPLAGATIAIGSMGMPEEESGSEDHGLYSVTTKTDAQGHWELNRIAEDALPYFTGEASHSNYTLAMVSIAAQPDALKQLRDGTFVFRLGIAGGVTGRVINESGEPVSNALVLVGHLDEVHSRSTRSDANGMFDVIGCQPGITPITASIKGYAPAAASVNVGSNMAPVVLTLGEGKTLRLRILDGKGRPIKGAGIWYDTFPPQSPHALPQVEFNPRSDTEGRAVWEHAPDQALEFRITATGFSDQEVSICPDDLEHDITFKGSLFISGTVRDADTGNLLPKFRLSIGTVTPDFSPTTRKMEETPWWSPIDRFNPVISGGEFRKSLDEPVIGGAANPGYIFRFAADGYKPEVTRLYKPDEGVQELSINLHKANEIQVTVYLPDGSVAADAQVGFMAPGAQLDVGIGRFNSPYDRTDPTWTRTTDANGRFFLPDDDQVQAVVIVHPDGFAAVAPGELRKTGVSRLEAWAVVNGVLMKGGFPLPNETLSLWSNPAQKNPFNLDHQAFSTETDAAGKFNFAKVPPGAFQILMWQPGTNAAGQGYSTGQPIKDLEVKGGEARELSLDAGTAPGVQANR